MLLWIYFRKEMKKELSINLTPSFLPVGVTGFEPATTRPPDAYSNRAELHPESLFFVCKGTYLWGLCKFSALFFCVNRDISCDCFVNVLYIKILHCKITMKLFVFVSAELS